MKKSQAWSLDIILAVILFAGSFFLIYFLLKPQGESSIDILSREAELVSIQFLTESSLFNLTVDGKLNETKLQQLIGDYSNIKSKIKVKGDFCIYLEDQNGNIIYLANNVTGIGSSKISIGNVTCQ